MAECKKCKYAEWNYIKFSPEGWIGFVDGCKLGNDEDDDCKYFEEDEDGET